MIVNPVICESCGKELQPENIGVRIGVADDRKGVRRICLFCENEVLIK